MKKILFFAVLVSILAPVREATAHARSMSYSRWEFDAAGATVRLRVSRLELTRFPTGQAEPSYFTSRLQLLRDGEPCAPGEATRIATASGDWTVYRWRIDCAEGGSRAIRSAVMDDVISTHAHFARIESEAGGQAVEIREKLLTRTDPVWELGDRIAASSGGSSLLDYVLLGASHILSGWDHLAFVAVLLLFAASAREVAVMVTGFTVAHSLTLALAVLGVVRPEPIAVEIHIGFSIALVAAENIWLMIGKDRWIPGLFTAALLGAMTIAVAGFGALGPWAWFGLAIFSICHFRLLDLSPNPARLRAGVTFAFGLVHGLGFAGALMELQLPAGRLVPALFGFNVGVELVQLLVIAMAWPVLASLKKGGAAGSSRLLSEWGSAALFGLGIFWVVFRTWG